MKKTGMFHFCGHSFYCYSREDGNLQLLITLLLVGITLLFLFACTPFPDNIDNTRSVSVQLIWNITASNISSPLKGKDKGEPNISSPWLVSLSNPLKGSSSSFPSLDGLPLISSPFEGESLSRTCFGNKGEGKNNKLSIKASYDDIVKAGVTTVVLKAEVDGNILKEKSFPVEARYGELNGLPAKNINIIAEARDGNETLFRGAKSVDLIKNDFIKITITMNETPEYWANKATPAPSIAPTMLPTPVTTPKPTIAPTSLPTPIGSVSGEVRDLAENPITANIYVFKDGDSEDKSRNIISNPSKGTFKIDNLLVGVPYTVIISKDGNENAEFKVKLLKDYKDITGIVVKLWIRLSPTADSDGDKILNESDSQPFDPTNDSVEKVYPLEPTEDVDGDKQLNIQDTQPFDPTNDSLVNIGSTVNFPFLL